MTEGIQQTKAPGGGPVALDPLGLSLGDMLKRALDSLEAGVFVCDAQYAGCPIVFISSGFSVITRYSSEDVLGRDLGRLLGPEPGSAASKTIGEALAEGRRFQGECQFSRKDGGTVWCDVILTPMADPNGLARHFAGLLTDATERKRRQERLLDAEEKYRGMFENAVEGIYQSTPDGRYLAVNPALARMYGYEFPAEMLNQVSDIQNQIYVDPAFRERFKREVEQSDLVRGLEYQVRRRDGSVIWISERARVVRDAKGDVRYYEGFIDDITQRKQAEADRARLEKQVVQTQKMEAMGTLAGGIAHDFNNILCAMRGLTELALGDTLLAGLTRKNLESVLKSADRAKDLIKQILTFSRRGETKHLAMRLGGILKECAKLLNATLPSSIGVESAVETEEDIVMADPTEMHQVIMNLGTNAAHAMRRSGGRLEFNLRAAELSPGEAAQMPPLRAGPVLCLAVRDTGHGMSREVLESIFDPFFTTKPAGEGTGLGLTLVQRIVAGSGGFITVESEEGAGTIFLVYLPRLPKAVVTPTPGRYRLLPGRREWILIVDDEISILGMMQQHLRRMGYRVITRAVSEEALETIRAAPGKYSLVITDHTMPCMQGAELAEKLGEICPRLPVILMTGLNSPPDFAGSAHAFRRAVVKKPIDFFELSHRMRHLLDGV